MELSCDIVVGCIVRHRASLFAYIWTLVADEHVAEDVLQELFIVIVQKHREINGEDHILPWARQTARFLAMNALRKLRKRPATLDDGILELLEPQWAAKDAVASHDTVEALRVCLGKLTPRARHIIALRYEQGLSGSELADQMQNTLRSTYTVMSRIHRTLAECIETQLQKRVADRG